MPNASPYSVSVSIVGRSKPATMPPMRADVAYSDAVLPAIDARYDASGRAALYVCRSSSIWPSHSRPIVRASSAATSVPSDAAISDARESRKSPARMACRLPHLAFTVSTPRRVGASSMTSSWYSDPVCTSSQAMPPWTASSLAGPSAICAATRVSTGRRRLPPATMRWEAMSLRYASGVRTDSTSAASMRSTSPGMPGSVKNGSCAMGGKARSAGVSTTNSAPDIPGAGVTGVTANGPDGPLSLPRCSRRPPIHFRHV